MLKNTVVKSGSKFKVGEVVRINTAWYKTKRKAEQYQRITGLFRWKESDAFLLGYKFLNGDRCHEQFVQPLTAKERGK